jgi:hypothetical protein
MNESKSESVEKMQPKGGSVSALSQSPIAVEPKRHAADEAALMNILRILNQIKVAPSPIERAFVLGAKALFEGLTQICTQLLAPLSTRATPDLPAAPKPVSEGKETPPSDSRRKRPTPGGGRSMQ